MSYLIFSSKGLTFTETWTTSNVLSAQLELENSIAQGLKIDLNGSLLPEKGTKNAKAGVEYKQDYVFTRSSLDLFKGPTLFADAVIGYFILFLLIPGIFIVLFTV